MKGNGFAFSFDLFISFLIICFMVYIILLNFDLMIESNRDAERDWLLQSKGIYLLDSLVKNSDENNSILGSAYYNSEKRRVEPNVIDYKLLKNANPETIFLGENIDVRELSLGYKSGNREIIYSKNLGGECISLERFVLIKKSTYYKKGKVRAKVCYEK